MSVPELTPAQEDAAVLVRAIEVLERIDPPATGILRYLKLMVRRLAQ